VQSSKELKMKKMLLTSLGMAALLAMTWNAQAAGNAQAGKIKAASCAGCHGPNGEGVGSNPALAGKSEEQLLQALQDYKSGKRANPIMKGMTGTLSDQDMADVAAYFASLKK
jgi:cytochrome c553